MEKGIGTESRNDPEKQARIGSLSTRRKSLFNTVRYGGSVETRYDTLGLTYLINQVLLSIYGVESHGYDRSTTRDLVLSYMGRYICLGAARQLET